MASPFPILHLFFTAALAVAFFLRPSSAAVIVVGGSTGWTANLVNSSFYTDWASGKTFNVGDTLRFEFTSMHTVQWVKKATYDKCVTNSNDGAIISSGPANVTLSATGPQHYICTVTGHCAIGQKLQINVTGGNATAAPSPANLPASPSPPSTQTAQPSPASPPPPPPPSSALALLSSFALSSASLLLAFFLF